MCVRVCVVNVNISYCISIAALQGQKPVEEWFPRIEKGSNKVIKPVFNFLTLCKTIKLIFIRSEYMSDSTRRNGFLSPRQQPGRPAKWCIIKYAWRLNKEFLKCCSCTFFTRVVFINCARVLTDVGLCATLYLKRIQFCRMILLKSVSRGQLVLVYVTVRM